MPDSAVKLERNGLRGFSCTRLRILADFGNLERSSIWHRRLGQVLQDAGYINAALKEFGASLALNGEDWMMLHRVSLCYAERKEYGHAIGWASKALAKLAQSSDNYNRAVCIWCISLWRMEDGDAEGAILAVREAMALLPRDVSVMVRYIYILCKASKFKEIIDIASNPQEHLSAPNGEEAFFSVLSSRWMQETLGRAARALKRTDVIIHALEKSFAEAEETGDTDGATERLYYLINFQYRHTAQGGRGTHLWEPYLERIQTRSSDVGLSSASLIALGQLYYDEAIEAEAQGQDFALPLSKLESIARLEGSRQPIDIDIYRGASILLLGLWNRLHNKPEDARACFKPKVLEAIDILTDEYPENDNDGFILLGQVLLKSGDYKGAAAAFSVPIATLDKFKAVQHSRQADKGSRKELVDFSLTNSNTADVIQQPSEVVQERHPPKPETHKAIHPDRSESKELDHHHSIEEFELLDLESQETTSIYAQEFDWTCDGQCTRGAEDLVEMYMCEVCFELSFCEECVAKVKENRLGFRVCNPSHTFWRVYPFDKKLLDVATENVNGKVQPRAAWLEKLREEWTN